MKLQNGWKVLGEKKQIHEPWWKYLRNAFLSLDGEKERSGVEAIFKNVGQKFS